ncbi:hypothetical protein B0H10DRAFT_563984 [Mycena sp. CBHHK59/15]|nr:hypothetical protein B0H10DRAFT_563984 [Mycena sp. CBHHK59/15]
MMPTMFIVVSFLDTSVFGADCSPRFHLQRCFVFMLHLLNFDGDTQQGSMRFPATLPRPLCDLPRCCGSLSRAGSRTHFLLSLFASDFPPSELAAELCVRHCQGLGVANCSAPACVRVIYVCIDSSAGRTWIPSLENLEPVDSQSPQQPHRFNGPAARK